MPEPLSLKHKLMLDGFRRIETHAPVYMLPRLIGTQHLFKTLSAARQRVCDGHKAQMKMMGEDVKNCGDDGGISVQGDTTINNTGLRALGTTAVILLALGAGAGLTALLYGKLGGVNQPTNNVSIESPEPASVDSWRLGLKVSDTP